MSNINSVVIGGRLTREPEIKTTNNGLIICKISLASSEYVKKEERTSFYDVTAFGKTAEFIEKYVKKGELIVVEGILRQERWKDDNDKNRSKVGIIANKIEKFFSKKQQEEPEQTQEAPDDDFRF